jgi:hypothetical protein
LTAPPRCARDTIPRVDASRVSQSDERIVGVLLPASCAPAKANNVNIPALRNRRNAARTRKLKNVARRKFFVFMAKNFGGDSQTRHLPPRETPNLYFSFSNNQSAVSFSGYLVVSLSGVLVSGALVILFCRTNLP